MKRKLFLLLCALLTTIGMWADTDCTSSVKKGQTDWGGSGVYTPHTLNVQMVEHYAGDLTAAGTTILEQTVTGLSAGTYTVVLYATANNARNASGIKSDAQDIAYVYAGSDKSHKAYVLSHFQDAFEMPHIYALNNVTVEADGNLEIGMYVEKTGTQWQTIQIKSLTKVDAVDEPNVAIKTDIGGSAISNTEAFTDFGTTSTIEASAVAFIPIHFNNDTEAFDYTPETTCTVRFVRTGGSIYVYEGNVFKGKVSTYTPTLYTTFAADYKPTNTKQLLQNPDFDVKGDALGGDNAWKVGTPWTSNVTWGNSNSGIRVRENSSKVVFLWRGSGSNAYFGQSLATLKPNTKYQLMLEQVASGNANARYYIGVGSSEGTHGLCETYFQLGTEQDGVKTGSFTTPNSIVNGTTYYFTFQNTSWNSSSSGSDPVTQIDWISLEEPFAWGLTGVSSASYLSGTAYRPYTLETACATFETARTTGATYTTEDWPRASTAKKTALDNAVAAEYPTSIEDAFNKADDIVTAYRQFVESNGTAEGVSGAIDFASAIAGADPDVNTGWTNGIGVDNRAAEKYTDGDGHTSGKYYDGGWSQTAAVDLNITREVTLPAGTYQLQVTARGSSSLTSYTMSIGGESVDLPKEGAGENTGTFGHGWSDKFIVFTSDGSTPLTLAIAATSTEYQQWISFNRFRLYNLGDATVSKSITAAGWATYCSPYALDLANATGLTDAYIVTGGNAGVLAMTSVKDGTVPANTGLLLKGDEGTATIPVVASSPTNVDDNKLVGVTSNTPLAAESGYVLMASPKLGFYKNANAFTVGANTAYLPIDFDENNTGARSAFFGFDENVTTINAIEATETEAGALKDGKYLINNKIVLVKNGVKYGANGQILK